MKQKYVALLFSKPITFVFSFCIIVIWEHLFQTFIPLSLLSVLLYFHDILTLFFFKWIIKFVSLSCTFILFILFYLPIQFILSSFYSSFYLSFYSSIRPHRIWSGRVLPSCRRRARRRSSASHTRASHGGGGWMMWEMRGRGRGRRRKKEEEWEGVNVDMDVYFDWLICWLVDWLIREREREREREMNSVLIRHRKMGKWFVVWLLNWKREIFLIKCFVLVR